MLALFYFNHFLCFVQSPASIILQVQPSVASANAKWNNFIFALLNS